MRRSILPAALLLLSGLASACAHQTSDSTLAPPTQATAELEEPELEALEEPEVDDGFAIVTGDPNVISFEEESGPSDMVIAPPKREDIPGFQLFGTGDTVSTPGPKLTLPDDLE